MDITFQRNAVTSDLLSKSYSERIQKLSGNEEKIPQDFQVPSHILEQREKSWNNLIAKYSSMVSEAELNIITLCPEEDESEPRARVPLRKPMSMVQYWVDTGNQPYTENSNNRSQSDSGSSLAEEELLEPDKVLNSPNASINLNPKKHSEIDDISDNLKLVNSSSTSVDTAAYILANNNTTKKADTIAIVEGAKTANKEQFPTLHSSKSVSDVDIATKDLKDTDLEQIENNNKSRDEEANDTQLVLHSESDESIIHSRYYSNIETQNSQLSKRKKLYCDTESIAEFTPSSECKVSLQTKRLSLKECEHPALKTPQLSSRPSYLIRHQRFKYKKRQRRRSRFSFLSKVRQKNKNQSCESDVNNKTLNSFTKSQESSRNCRNSQNTKNNETNCDKVVSANDDCRNRVDMAIQNFHNSEKALEDTKTFKLKCPIIKLQRLPHMYEKPNSKRNLIQTDIQKNESLQKNERKFKKHFKKAHSLYNHERNLINNNKLANQDNRNHSILLNDETSTEFNKYQLNENTSNNENIEKHSIDTTNSSFEKLKVVQMTNDEFQFTSLSENSANKKSRMQKDKSTLMKSMKYTLVISSDESDIVIDTMKDNLRSQSLKKNSATNRKSLKNNEFSVRSLLTSSSQDESCSKLKSTRFPNNKKELSILSRKRKREKISTFRHKNIDNIITDSLSEDISTQNNKKLLISKQNNKNLLITSSDEEISVHSPEKLSKSSNKIELKINSDKKSTSSNRKSNKHQTADGICSEEDLQLPVTESIHSDKNKVGNNKGSSVEKVNTNKKVGNVQDMKSKIKMKLNDVLLFTQNLCNNASLENIKSVSTSFKSFDKKNLEQNEKKAFKVTSNQKCAENNKDNLLKEFSKNSKSSINKRRKYVSNKSKIKNSKIVISSDEECIIPLKIKSNKNAKQQKDNGPNSYS